VAGALDLFSQGVVRDWFAKKFDAPTDIQAQAWPAIAAGEHVLLTAPTGSGKTLTAFLWAMDRLASGAWEPGGVRVLYVSPLKALNNDIRRNLLGPLEEMGLSIGVKTRSGDTPQHERRAMLRRPPEILVTTPESLNLLLNSHGGRAILGGVETVILDEIHAVAGDKRGAYLMSAVERLVDLSGEFQRISLSATIRPLELVAGFVGGMDRSGRPRPVRTLESEDQKPYEVSVRCLDEQGWPPLVEEFRQIARKNRSTLFFVNNRSLCEKLVRWINDDHPEPIAYAHHGSLSREIRALVEQRLRQGDLKAIVATSSLEMGIDIGELDEVVLVQSPRSINSAIQRIGRAGHSVGEISRGRIYPTHARDFLDACVLAPLIEQRRCETLVPVRNPLDVLAQVITAMCGVERIGMDDLFSRVRRIWSFSTLQREAFDHLLAMLTGRYADTRIRELKPRVRTDPDTNEVWAREGVLPLVWRSGGVIADRGYFAIRIGQSGARLGELDEEFVWERRIGDHFTIGAQAWRIESISRNDVVVAPSDGTKVMAPFWRAERFDRDFELCEAISEFLERADTRLDDDALRTELETDHLMAPAAANKVIDLLARQRKHTSAPLPHRRHLLVEHLTSEPRQVILHAGWGGKVLRPWAVALAAATGFETFANDDGLMVQVKDHITAADLLAMVTPENVESLLRNHLEQTGFFGARFRENAMRALLLPRMRANQRLPLWLSRLRAKKLLQAVGRYADFPIVAETWRTCLEDEFDLARLRALLDEVRTGEIKVTEVHTSFASPLAEGLAWKSTNQYMYEDDRPLGREGSSLSDQALAEVLHDSALRPKLDPALIVEFEAKLQGRAPGYELDPVAMVEERLIVKAWPGELPPELARIDDWIVPAAQKERVEHALGGDPDALRECIAEFLQTHGPVEITDLACWGAPVAVQRALDELVEERRLVADRFRAGATTIEYCDAENLERLLRLTRAAARPAFRALPIEQLAPWLARWQGLVDRSDSIDGLRNCLERLFGFVAPARLWESAYLPARLAPYHPAWLDQLMAQSDLLWFGGGDEQIGFCFFDDLALFLPDHTDPPELLPDPMGSYDFFELQKRGDQQSAELAHELWSLAWEGRATNDTFAALRKGIATKFKPARPEKRRRGLNAWASSRPLLGRWRALERPGPGDRLQEAQQDKQRARQLLARYGILFRQLCATELPALRWGRLLKALKVLELSGEVLAGQFFDGVEGLQFATHQAFSQLRRGADDDKDAVFWLNATDPASLCGTGLGDDLPPRLASTWLVYHGPRLILVARRNGRDLELRADPDPRYLDLFGFLRGRGRLEIETINGEQATTSPHADALVAFGFLRDRRSLCLERTL